MVKRLFRTAIYCVTLVAIGVCNEASRKNSPNISAEIAGDGLPLDERTGEVSSVSEEPDPYLTELDAALSAAIDDLTESGIESDILQVSGHLEHIYRLSRSWMPPSLPQSPAADLDGAPPVKRMTLGRTQ